MPIVFLYLLVGILWGCTNPFMKKAYEKEKEEKNLRREMISLLSNLGIIIPYLCNQLGSVCYYYLLSKSELSLVQPLANTFSFIFTYLTEIVLFKKKVSLKSSIGLLLVGVGTFLCLHS